MPTSYHLFTLGRWIHVPHPATGRFVVDPDQPPLRFPIHYTGQTEHDARYRFLSDHRLDDMAEWVDAIMWATINRWTYAAYVHYANRQHQERLTVSRRHNAASHGIVSPSPTAVVAVARRQYDVRTLRRILARELANQISLKENTILWAHTASSPISPPAVPPNSPPAC